MTYTNANVAMLYRKYRAQGEPAHRALEWAKYFINPLGDWKEIEEPRSVNGAGFALTKVVDGFILIATFPYDEDSDPVADTDTYGEFHDDVREGDVYVGSGNQSYERYAEYERYSPHESWTIAERAAYYHKHYGMARGEAQRKAREDTVADAFLARRLVSYGVVVTATRVAREDEDVELGNASVWGCDVDPDKQDESRAYLRSTADEEAHEALAQARATLDTLHVSAGPLSTEKDLIHILGSTGRPLCEEGVRVITLADVNSELASNNRDPIEHNTAAEWAEWNVDVRLTFRAPLDKNPKPFPKDWAEVSSMLVDSLPDPWFDPDSEDGLHIGFIGQIPRGRVEAPVSPAAGEVVCDPNSAEHMFTPWCHQSEEGHLIEHEHEPNVPTYWFKKRILALEVVVGDEETMTDDALTTAIHDAVVDTLEGVAAIESIHRIETGDGS